MIASKRGGSFKQATLSEAYEFFTGKKLEGAHDAMVDVRACMEVYFSCIDWKAP
jgi:DNA polymerase-3 subunit epsilon